MKEKSTDFVTPTKASWEAQEEEISPKILEAAKTLSKVASQGVSKEKSTDKGKIYRRIASKRGQREGKALMEEEPVKRTGKRKKQKARKGINVDKSAQEDSETDKEVPTDEDGYIRIGDLTGVSAPSSDEIFSGGKKSRESNISGGENTDGIILSLEFSKELKELLSDEAGK
ncbi:hypothetical protein Tco_0567902 [Tanacetum coccineum]